MEYILLGFAVSIGWQLGKLLVNKIIEMVGRKKKTNYLPKLKNVNYKRYE